MIVEHITLLPDWPILSSLLIILYAEIHFRYPGLPSLYFRKQPEIIADVPHRLSPGHDLPLLLITKDAHLFPMKILHITANMIAQERSRVILDESMDVSIDDDYHEWLWFLKIPESNRGHSVMIDVNIQIEISGKTITICNDNYPQTSHKPFTVLLDDHPLPKSDQWVYGDLHCHSNLTSDQVEFGASISATTAMAKAMGLDFASITDHSYDLDDLQDDYLHNDPMLNKWHQLWSTVEQTNVENPDFILIPGEELSAGNHLDRNVHCLLLNNRMFFEGAGDSFEPGFSLKPYWGIDKVLPLLSKDALALAAHPESVPPLSQKLLINRGKWHEQDYTQSGLHGVQMWNGDSEHFQANGLQKWIALLLQGQRLVLTAGNDAHGNFNRFRQLTIPFIKMIEHDKEVFARARTVVKLDGEKQNISAIINAIKRGRVMVTDGPFIECCLQSGEQYTDMGDTFTGAIANVNVLALSTPHIGEIVKIELYTGNLETRKEICYSLPISPKNPHKQHISHHLDELPRKGYIRLAVTSKTRDRVLHGYTNPIYIEN